MKFELPLELVSELALKRMSSTVVPGRPLPLQLQDSSACRLGRCGCPWKPVGIVERADVDLVAIVWGPRGIVELAYVVVLVWGHVGLAPPAHVLVPAGIVGLA